MDKKILIVTGDPSGDFYAANLARLLLQEDDKLKLYGLGGKRLKDAGVELLYNLVDEALIGFYEALRKWFTFRRIFNDIVLPFLQKNKPDLVLLVDFYGFNIHIAGASKRLNIPVVYYISPKVWAWQRRRIKKIAERINKMLVIFPFEENLYKKEGVDVTFVGNPISDIIHPKGDRESVYKEFNLRENLPVVGLLPGSRLQEIDNILPPMLNVAKKIAAKQEVQFVLVLADNISEKYVKNRSQVPGVRCQILRDNDYNLRSIMTLSLVASGTATLENAYLGIPMIIMYKTSFLSYLLAKLLVKIPYVGLPNIVAGREVVPEFVQTKIVPEKIAELATGWLKNPETLKEIKEELLNVKGKMGPPGATRRVVKILREIVYAR